MYMYSIYLAVHTHSHTHTRIALVQQHDTRTHMGHDHLTQQEIVFNVCHMYTQFHVCHMFTQLNVCHMYTQILTLGPPTKNSRMLTTFKKIKKRHRSKSISQTDKCGALGHTVP